MDYRLPMLATTLFLLSCGESGLAAPFPTRSNPCVDPLEPRDEIRFITNYRSTPEIIWTCIITTFLCAWVSVHPNIVGYNSNRWQRLHVRLTLFLQAFAAPEVSLLAALQQWMVATYIAEKINERVLKSPKERIEEKVEHTLWERLAGKMRIKRTVGRKDARCWNTVHGHFLLMGGVIFSVNGRLEYLELQRLIEIEDDNRSNDEGPNGEGSSDKGLIENDDDNRSSDEGPNDEGSNDKGPNDEGSNTTGSHDNEKYAAARAALESLPTRDMEISDRSKGDAVTKGLTLLQTTWFIVQLASRRVQNLNVTALEILTLAYAVMNLFVYIFWWNKPLNVQYPIVISITVERNAAELLTSHSDELEIQPVPRASPSPAPNEIPSSSFILRSTVHILTVKCSGWDG